MKVGYRTPKFNKNLFLAKSPISIISGKFNTRRKTIPFLTATVKGSGQLQKQGYCLYRIMQPSS